MTATALLWLYGALGVSCALLTLMWGKVVRGYAVTGTASVWSVRFMLGCSLTLHSAAMGVACGYRTWDTFTLSDPAAGSSSSFLIIVLLMMLASGVGFVWAGSVDEAARRVRWPWWAFVYALILWGLFCLAWNGRWI